MQISRDPRVGCVGVRVEKSRHRATVGALGLLNDGARGRRSELATIVRVGEKGDGDSPAPRESAYAVDNDVRVAANFAVERAASSASFADIPLGRRND